jgi:hypothetical protein
LPFTHHHPAGIELCDRRGAIAAAAALHQAVYRGEGLRANAHS